MASASLGNRQSNNLYAYVQNMPTDYVDPSGLQMVPFTMTVCSRWERPEDRVCVEVVIHWMNIGNGGGNGGDDFGSGGNQGSPRQETGKCVQGVYGTDQLAIEEKLKAAGLWDFIDPNSVRISTTNSRSDKREGIQYTIIDRQGFLNAVDANPAFTGPTIFGAEHTSQVGATLLSVQDFRSFTTGRDTLGSDPFARNRGIVRSLQVVVGDVTGINQTDPTKQTAEGYSDLDCSNPAQDIWSMIKHLFGR